jgi:hypothetical protein
MKRYFGIQQRADMAGTTYFKLSARAVLDWLATGKASGEIPHMGDDNVYQGGGGQ